MIAPAADRPRLLAHAAECYQKAQQLSFQMLLKYYIDASFVARALPPGYSQSHAGDHKGIDDLSFEQAMQAVITADELRVKSKVQYQNTDRFEFDRFVARAGARLQAIDNASNGK